MKYVFESQETLKEKLTDPVFALMLVEELQNHINGLNIELNSKYETITRLLQKLDAYYSKYGDLK